ncbi:hypothetical protein J6590_102647, partial [Homalodisca vitripennis]
CLEFVVDFEVLTELGSNHLHVTVNFYCDVGKPGTGYIGRVVERREGILLQLLQKMQ